MRLKPFLTPLALATCAGLAAQPAFAGPSGYPVQAPDDRVGSVIVRIGASYVDPDDDTFSTVQSFLADDPSTEASEAVPVDVGVDVDLDDDTTWYLSVAWMAMDHWGVELYHSNEADLEADLGSAAFSGADFIGAFSEGIGDFETSTTSLFVNWYPLDANCLIQPYGGIGVSYVNIEEDFVRPVFRSEEGNFGVLGFGSDFSWTAQLGVDFNFGPDSAWQVNASAMYVDAQPDLHLGFDTATDVPGFGDSAILPIRIRSEMDLDPWIFNLGVGYKFSF